MKEITNLPTDMQLYIIEFLNYRDVAALEASCHSLVLLMRIHSVWTKQLLRVAPSLKDSPHYASMPHKILLKHSLFNSKKQKIIRTEIASLKQEIALEEKNEATDYKHPGFMLPPINFFGMIQCYQGIFRSLEKRQRKKQIAHLEKQLVAYKI
jgi:hypothetical protein